MVRKAGEAAPLVAIVKPGDVLLEQGGRETDVLAVSSDGVLVADRPAGRRGLRLRYRFANGEVTRDLAVRSLEERGTDFGKAYFLHTARDPRVPRLAEFVNRGFNGSAGFIRAANDVGTNRRTTPAPKTARSVMRFVGAAVGLSLAGALFISAAYMRYGVATFSGSIEPKSVELLRAEHPGVFFPYAPGGNHVLAVGELVGVIDGGGRSYSVTATCACLLGDFPVSAGSTLFKGAVVARLIPPDSDVEVVARLPLADEWQVAVGDPVSMEVEGRRVTGRVQLIETDRNAALWADNDAPSQNLAILHIAPDEAIDPALFGSEITVKVLRAQALASRAAAYLRETASGWTGAG
jgi:hypothetical protein